MSNKPLSLADRIRQRNMEETKPEDRAQEQQLIQSLSITHREKYFTIADYKKDNYSDHNSCNTICCRGDLVSDNPRPSGCYDSKVKCAKI